MFRVPKVQELVNVSDMLINRVGELAISVAAWRTISGRIPSGLIDSFQPTMPTR